MKQLFYLPYWYLTSVLFGRKKPLQSVIFITDECNLTCKHCCVYQLENKHIKTFDMVKKEIDNAYKKGSRFIDFEGGEPMIWRDGDKNINDLIAYAKALGFFSTTITTNGILPFSECKADSIWISLDGIDASHDAIRGKGSFAALAKNLGEATRKNISANMVVNAVNYQDVEKVMNWVNEHPNLQSLAVNFHTPFPGTEKLLLERSLRNEVIDTVIEYKKKGHRIQNSVSGLKIMKGAVTPKYCWISDFYLPDGSYCNTCEGKNHDLCGDCGFCMAGEMKSLVTLRPDTIISGLKLRISNQ